MQVALVTNNSLPAKHAQPVTELSVLEIIDSIDHSKPPSYRFAQEYQMPMSDNNAPNDSNLLIKDGKLTILGATTISDKLRRQLRHTNVSPCKNNENEALYQFMLSNKTRLMDKKQIIDISTSTCLTGPKGCGKTTAANHALAKHKGLVYLVDTAELKSSRSIYDKMAKSVFDDDRSNSTMKDVRKMLIKKQGSLGTLIIDNANAMNDHKAVYNTLIDWVNQNKLILILVDTEINISIVTEEPFITIEMEPWNLKSVQSVIQSITGMNNWARRAIERVTDYDNNLAAIRLDVVRGYLAECIAMTPHDIKNGNISFPRIKGFMHRCTQYAIWSLSPVSKLMLLAVARVIDDKPRINEICLSNLEKAMSKESKLYSCWTIDATIRDISTNLKTIAMIQGTCNANAITRFIEIKNFKSSMYNREQANEVAIKLTKMIQTFPNTLGHRFRRDYAIANADQLECTPTLLSSYTQLVITTHSTLSKVMSYEKHNAHIENTAEYRNVSNHFIAVIQFTQDPQIRYINPIDEYISVFDDMKETGQSKERLLMIAEIIRKSSRYAAELRASQLQNFYKTEVAIQHILGVLLEAGLIKTPKGPIKESNAFNTVESECSNAPIESFGKSNIELILDTELIIRMIAKCPRFDYTSWTDYMSDTEYTTHMSYESACVRARGEPVDELEADIDYLLPSNWVYNESDVINRLRIGYTAIGQIHASIQYQKDREGAHPTKPHNESTLKSDGAKHKGDLSKRKRSTLSISDVSIALEFTLKLINMNPTSWAY
jgi:hypothetical protein